MRMLRDVFFVAALASSGAALAALSTLTGVVQVEAGARAYIPSGPNISSGCALTSGGAVKCWGHGLLLGDGSGNSRSFAGDVVGLSSGVVAIAINKGYDEFDGFAHACAIVTGGGVKCWGSNGSGQLGDGTTTTRLTPIDVVGLPAPAVELALGHMHSCAVLNTGALECWGANDSGQLGDGTTVGKLVPSDVAGLSSGVAHVSAAAHHACAVTTGGAVKCWGKNDAGQLGDGTTTGRLTPTDVQSLSSGIAFVSAGGANKDAPPGWELYSSPTSSSFTCAVTVSGGAKCWGALDGTTQSGPRLTPVDVPGLTSGVVDLSGGGMRAYCCDMYFYGSMASACVLTSTGGVKCWGSMRRVFENGPFYSATPLDFAGLTSGIAGVSVGGDFACALTTDGRVLCGKQAGYMSFVQTGTGSQSIVFGPKPTIPVRGTGSVGATGGASGNPVVFTSFTPSVCSISGSTVSGLAQGLCTIAANQAGNAYYEPAPQVTLTFRIGDPVSQTITWGPAPTVPVNGAGSLQATASSGLPVTFTSNTPSICTVSGNTVTGVAQGSCTITAIQPGDELYSPAPQVTQTFPVTANSGTWPFYISRTGAGSGTVTSSPAAIQCGSVCVANFADGTTVTLTATPAAGSKFGGWSGPCGGTGSCIVTTRGPLTVTALFVIDSSPIPSLTNISTRGQVLSGNDVMIAGFIIGGSASKTVVINVAGPSLVPFGIANALMNPTLTLMRSSDQSVIKANDDWQTQTIPGDVAAIQASGFQPNNSAEPAIIATLAPGGYTAIVQGAGGTTGVGLVGVFEVDHPDIPLVNISTRGQVLTGNDVMIAGFVIGGTASQTVVVNVAGPSLSNFGITNPLANPMLTLVRSSDNAVIATNDDWQSAANAAQIQASGFAPSNPFEPAIMMTLAPGAYTAIVQGSRGSTGVGLVGVFAVP